MRRSKQIFGFTPSELRSKRRRTDLVEADGGIALTISFDIDIRWDAVLDELATTAVLGVEEVADRCYRRVIAIAGNPGAVQITDLDPRTLRVEAHLPRFDSLIDIASYARQLVGPRTSSPRLEGWTNTEAQVRHLLVTELGDSTAQDILSKLAQRRGSELHPLRPLGLTHSHPEYRSLSNEDWMRAGLPTRLLHQLPGHTARPIAPSFLGAPT